MPPQFTPPITAGIDLGGTHAQVGLVDATGRLLARANMMTHAEKGAEDVIARLAEAVEEACAQADINVGKLNALGVGAPGFIDLPNGVVINAPNIKWFDVPLAERLGQHLSGLRVVVDNDVNAAIVGEHAHGAARGASHAMGIWVGTGVGGGVIHNGRIFHGAFGSAAEIGMTCPWPNAKPEDRKIDYVCSRHFMTQRMLARINAGEASALAEKHADGERITAHDLKDAWDANDTIVREEIARGARILGLAVANALTLFAVPLVVMGGGITEVFGREYTDLVKDAIEQDVFPDGMQVDVRLTELRENAGLIGAAVLAR